MNDGSRLIGQAEQEIAYYVERVRAALADLPPQTRDELLEDLPEHLAEVAAEAGGSLTDRLGTPEAYAAELRVAAGVAVAGATPNLDQRIGAAAVAARTWLRTTDAKLGPMIGYAKASDFLRLLRPAWWVLRGYLVAMFITVELTGQQFGLLPRLGTSTLAALLLLTACVVGSIWLGRRSEGLTRWRRLALNIGTALVVLFGVVGFVDADQYARNQGYYAPSSNMEPYTNIQDIFVYDSQGRLVNGARLFDQNGQPIRLGYASCPDSQQYDNGHAPTYPYCPQQAPFQFSGPGGPSLTPLPDQTPPDGPGPTPSEATSSPGPATPTPVPVPSSTPAAPVGPVPTG